MTNFHQKGAAIFNYEVARGLFALHLHLGDLGGHIVVSPLLSKPYRSNSMRHISVSFKLTNVLRDIIYKGSKSKRDIWGPPWRYMATREYRLLTKT